MKPSEVDAAFLHAKSLGQTLVEYAAWNPPLLAILVWTRWDQIKGIFLIKIPKLGIVLKDFRPDIEKKLIIPLVGPRPTFIED